ncbi:2OG-Fe dioxygenase family protein [Salinispora oceanensis]|uniref:2OG-Fe dioxygenase family protein n=1 Tax=Salinispora oceanensis TaxID=1050199 RepID=UPI00036B38F6|nr:2OG-Fe dioxygenase family protein [Salinispora oceanensis]
MSSSTVLSVDARAIVAALSDTHECLVSAADLSRILDVDADDWARFARNWDDLEQDMFMADGGTYRHRRYGQFMLDPHSGELTALPHEPYRQELFFNRLNGGVDRIYEPLTEVFAGDRLLRNLLVALGRIFTAIDDTQRWLIKLHPVRITAGKEMGKPAPEGRHRDGVTFVGSLIIDRLNITGGESSTYNEAGERLRTVTLAERGELLLNDDQRTYHAVTPIEAIDKDQPAHRDVLVLNYSALPGRL